MYKSIISPNERSVRNSPPESESRSSSLPASLDDRIVAVVLSEILDRFDPEMINAFSTILPFSSEERLFVCLRTALDGNHSFIFIEKNIANNNTAKILYRHNLQG